METAREIDGVESVLAGLTSSEWLVANGIGGYASSTIPSLNTRKYHGLLVAAMTPAVRRMVILSRVEETIIFAGRRYDLACNEYPQTVHPQGYRYLKAFSHEPYPRWAYQGEGWTVEKHLQMVPGRNAVLLSYTVWGGSEAGSLELRPLLALRPMHELMYQWNGPLRVERVAGGSVNQYRVPATSRTPEAFFSHHGGWEPAEAGGASWYLNTIYRREQERGYAGLEDLWCPGIVHLRLSPGVAEHFVCSTDPMSVEDALGECEHRELPTKPAMSVPPTSMREPSGSAAGRPDGAEGSAPADKLTEAKNPAAAPRRGVGVEAEIDAETATLLSAADSFTVAREFSPTRVPVLGDYHWASPSVRNALIGFTGMYLVRGRFEQGRRLLLALAGLLKDGLLPASLAEDAGDSAFHAADVSLWFVNAVWNYLRYSQDQATVQHALLGPVLSVIEHYTQGTAPGIRVDEEGLLHSHMTASAMTWMDAKLGDWIVTPRAGAAVEVNALWHNALRVAAALMELPGVAKPPESLSVLSAKCCAAFNRRFWNHSAGCCFDVIDDKSVDPVIRPNQLLAASLPFPVLQVDRHGAMLDRCSAALLTPFGLRTLSDRDPAYRGRYGGDIVSRERALHNGSVFPWLLGPWVTAMVRLRGRHAVVLEEARSAMRPSIERIRGAGMGHLCELFDGEAPHAPGGAIASALGVGEMLRCYFEDILDRQPPRSILASGNALTQLA